jgi:hypothetical protein
MNFVKYESYDWYSSTIAHYLPFLRTFRCFLYGTYYGYSDDRIKNITEKMKQHFQIMHNDRYQSKLIFHLTGYKRINQCGHVFGKYRKSKSEM